MKSPDTLDPLTVFFLDGIRQTALVETFARMGWPTDVFANSLDRAAAEAASRTVSQIEVEPLRRAAAIAAEQARQLRLGDGEA